MAYPGERFSSEVSLTPSDASAYARAVGDTNPVHHDAEYARSTRFGRLIASGTHTTALLLALTASHFSKSGAMLGLERGRIQGQDGATALGAKGVVLVKASI